MSIRVLVADDQSMVRAGFRMLLAVEDDIEVIAEASNGLEAVDKAARFHPTVVLMDIRMPQLDGLEATRRILAADKTARILILRRSTSTNTSTRRSAPAPAGSYSRTILPSSSSPRYASLPMERRCSLPPSPSA